jgi:hypothetical protein
MNINEHIIVWEKWKDPFGFDNIESIDASYNDDHYNDNEQPIEQNIKKIKCQLISTPLGIIPFNETISSSDIFNFWTGHSNFALTRIISSIIEDTPGVETLNIFTKYRFRIGIGKAFSDSLVMREINKNVYDYLEEMKDNYVK